MNRRKGVVLCRRPRESSGGRRVVGWPGLVHGTGREGESLPNHEGPARCRCVLPDVAFGPLAAFMIIACDPAVTAGGGKCLIQDPSRGGDRPR